MQCIAFDSHKHYTWALVQDETGRIMREQRIEHAQGALQGFLEEFKSGCCRNHRKLVLLSLIHI